MQTMGIDIGGTGIKAAIVNTDTGELLTDRIRYETPKTATPQRVIKILHELCDELSWDGPVGCGFPGVVIEGVARTAANLHNDWIDFPLEEALHHELGRPAYCLNDADAAGLAEMRFGAASNSEHPMLMLTVGTGIGSALFNKNHLIPNTELGHLLIKLDQPHCVISAEDYASNRARKLDDLSWPEWTERFNKVLANYCFLLNPSHVILGGGIIKKWNKLEKHLIQDTPVVPAKLGNLAGIIGAAIHARETSQKTS